jgi:hypothetical protein
VLKESRHSNRFQHSLLASADIFMLHCALDPALLCPTHR